jgi:hypothetical protein
LGALTLKPSAYSSRPWETTEVSVFNHLEGNGSVSFHLRGGRVIKVTSPGWLTDRARFSYDGHRRQRFVTPLVRGVPVSWPTGLTRWWDYLVGGHRFEFDVDPSTGGYFFWLFRVYSAVADRRGRPVGVSFDGGGSTSGVYHGAFGLSGVAHADVALPACLPHEEEGHLRHPTGGVTLFLFAAAGFQLVGSPRPYRFGMFDSAADGHPRRVGHALLQVSPLQRVLAGW